METRKVEGFYWYAGQDPHWMDAALLPCQHHFDAQEVQWEWPILSGQAPGKSHLPAGDSQQPPLPHQLGTQTCSRLV